MADQDHGGNLKLNVMSFNIRTGSADDGQNSWNFRREMVYDILRNHNPSIVGLQEALRFQIDETRQAVPEYGEIGVGRDDGRTGGEYCAILYQKELFDLNESGTFWFSNTPEVPGSSHWGNANVRICTWARFMPKKSKKAFYVFNLHLDHISQPSREKSVLLLARRIGERKYKERFVVMGDFNSGEDNPAIRYMKGDTSLGDGSTGPQENSSPMIDTFRVIHPDAAEVGTFNRFKGIRTGDKIDYIFITPDVRVLDAQIIYDNTDGRYPSDHFPITAKIEIK
jgi:endonuclease/exonuclease/phosphatase family metal-dependent hydrolase